MISFNLEKLLSHVATLTHIVRRILSAMRTLAKYSSSLHLTMCCSRSIAFQPRVFIPVVSSNDTVSAKTANYSLKVTGGDFILCVSEVTDLFVDVSIISRIYRRKSIVVRNPNFALISLICWVRREISS